MDLVRLPGPSRRTVVLLLDGPRPTETLESRRGRATRRPRERSSRCVPSTLEVRVLWVERTREKRRVSRPLQSRDVSRPCSASPTRHIFVYICGSRCLFILRRRLASRYLVQYSSNQKQVVLCRRPPPSPRGSGLKDRASEDLGVEGGPWSANATSAIMRSPSTYLGLIYEPTCPFAIQMNRVASQGRLDEANAFVQEHCR